MIKTGNSVKVVMENMKEVEVAECVEEKKLHTQNGTVLFVHEVNREEEYAIDVLFEDLSIASFDEDELEHVDGTNVDTIAPFIIRLEGGGIIQRKKDGTWCLYSPLNFFQGDDSIDASRAIRLIQKQGKEFISEKKLRIVTLLDKALWRTDMKEWSKRIEYLFDEDKEILLNEANGLLGRYETILKRLYANGEKTYSYRFETEETEKDIEDIKHLINVIKKSGNEHWITDKYGLEIEEGDSIVFDREVKKGDEVLFAGFNHEEFKVVDENGVLGTYVNGKFIVIEEVSKQLTRLNSKR